MPATSRRISATCTRPERVPAGQVARGSHPRDHGSGPKAQAREEHLHLLYGRVLRFIQNHKGVVERSPAHVGKGRDLNDVALDELVDPLETEHLRIERVIEGAQVGVDFLREITGKEPELLLRFHRRADQENASHALRLQRLNRTGHGQVGFAVPAGPMPKQTS